MSNNSSNTYIIKNKSIASLNEVYKLIIRGEYIVFIISEGTKNKAAFEDRSAYETEIAGKVTGYVNSDNAKLLGEDVGFQKYNVDSIIIRKDTNTTYSYDFGITYI